MLQPLVFVNFVVLVAVAKRIRVAKTRATRNVNASLVFVQVTDGCLH